MASLDLPSPPTYLMESLGSACLSVTDDRADDKIPKTSPIPGMRYYGQGYQTFFFFANEKANKLDCLSLLVSFRLVYLCMQG